MLVDIGVSVSDGRGGILVCRMDEITGEYICNLAYANLMTFLSPSQIRLVCSWWLKQFASVSSRRSLARTLHTRSPVTLPI